MHFHASPPGRFSHPFTAIRVYTHFLVLPCLARTHSRYFEYVHGLKLSPRPRTVHATFEAHGAKQCLTDPWQESASGWLPGEEYSSGVNCSGGVGAPSVLGHII